MRTTQRRMVLVVNFFPIFEIRFSGFAVAIFDLVHNMKALFDLP